MINAMELGAPMELKTKAKHVAKSWGYPGMDDETPEFAVSCSCGFNEAGLGSMEEAVELETAHWKQGYVKAFKPETLYTKKGEEVITAMSDEDAIEVLRQHKRGNNFAMDLVRGFEKYKSATDGQRPWIHKLANEAVAPKPQRKLSAQVFTRLVDMMQSAAMELTRPKITFDWEGRTVQLSIAGNAARVPGSLNVTDGGPYGDSTWYGRILPNGDDRGKFDAGRAVEDWVIDALVALNADPVAAAREHGHRTGNCCFCNRHIETKESMHVGYGPICAGRYGLPWGETS